MKKYTFTGKLIRYERRDCGCYGNPKFFGVFENENGEILQATTASNASCAYGFLNQIDNEREITYHTTKNGNNIIDYIKIKDEVSSRL